MGQHSNETLSDEMIVCLSETEWNSGLSGRQQIARGFAKENDVLYVNPSTALRGGARREMQQLFRSNAFDVGDRIRVLEFPRTLGRSYRPLIERTLRSRRLDAIKRVCRKAGKDPVVIAFHPTAFSYVDKLDAKAIAFHAYDNYSAYSGTNGDLNLLFDEEKLARRSDVVFAVTKDLADRYGRWNENIEVVPNGADYDLFSAAHEKPHELATVSKPIACLVARLTVNIDCNILRQIVATNRWQLVVVGPLRPMPDALKREAVELLSDFRVIWVGEKAPTDAAAYIAHSDVCICPYRRNGITQFGSPLKVYEYLAAGKPVVSTRIPAMEHIGIEMEFPTEVCDWPGALDRALRTNTPQKRESRTAIAFRNSWTERVQTMSKRIASLINGRMAGRALDVS